MAKKTANPADAHRKAQRQKELKRNKENRTKTREVATLKKDTGGLEARIRTLSSSTSRSPADSAELTSLQAELASIQTLKREYVEKHPEHRKFVYARETAAEEEKARREKEKEEGIESRGLYDKEGRLRRPERSFYYDPILNPYGVPPPGMPYRERPPTPEPLPKELQSDAESDSSDDDDDEDSDSDESIVLPSGPPPGVPTSDAASSDDDSDSDGSIIFPSGPPPPQPSSSQPPLPAGPPPNFAPFNPQFPPPGFYPLHQQQQGFMHPSMNLGGPMPAQMGYYPPPRPGVNVPYQPGGGGHMPYAQGGRGGFGPRGGGGARRPPAAHQHHSTAGPSTSSLPKAPSSLPKNPNKPPPPPPPPVGLSALEALAQATTAAEPVLRDFRKEASAFVPAAVKRRRKEEEAKEAKRVKSAPSLELPGDSGGWGAPLEGFDDPDPEEETRPEEGVDFEPTRVVPKAKSFGGVNNPLLGGLADVLGKAGFGKKGV